jgi:hypothetical protein
MTEGSVECLHVMLQPLPRPLFKTKTNALISQRNLLRPNNSHRTSSKSGKMFEDSQIDPALTALADLGVPPTPISPLDPLLKPSIILFNGYPGVGKMTIATHLLKLLRSSYPSPVHLIDRNLLIDPVQAIEPDQGPKHRQLIKTVRKAIFDGIKEIGDPKATIIMTEFLCTREASKHMFQEYLDVAQFRGLPLIYVEINCSTKENMARVVNPKRKRYISKLTDKDRLQEMVLSDTLLDPADSIDLKGVEIRCIDQWTGNVTAEAAALELMNKLKDIVGFEDK